MVSPDDTMLVSACLIVRDEEENLPGCLASLAGLVDEVVVADTGSSDRSREIARAAGARVVDVTWEDDFSRARNASLAYAQGEWVVVLDADERLLEHDFAAFRRELVGHPEPALTLEIRSKLAGGAETVAHVTRVFRNDPAHRYQGRLHEQIVPAIARKLGNRSLAPPRSGLVAIHDGYLPEARRARGKAERNERLLRAMLADEPENTVARHLLARELLQEVGGDILATPRSREALELMDRASATLPDLRQAHVAEMTLRRVRSRIALGQATDESQTLAGLRSAAGDRPLIAFAEGEAALALSRPEEAEDRFRAALALADVADIGEADPRYAGAWARERVARARLVLKDLAAAERIAGESLERARSEAGPRIVLAGVALASGDVRGALTQLVEAAKASPQDPRPHLELARVLAQVGQAEAAARSAAAALRSAPGWEEALKLGSGR